LSPSSCGGGITIQSGAAETPVPNFLITYQPSFLFLDRCTTQVISDLVSAEEVAQRFARENGVAVLRCQLLGKEAHLHPTDWCIYDSKDPNEPAMTQAPPVPDDLPEDDEPETPEEE
jgi:hypothetical protein